MSKHRNGVAKVTEKPRSEVPWLPQRNKNVIAIDFGTSTLAVSYMTDGATQCKDIILTEATGVKSAPTVLYIGREGTTIIGDPAIKKFTDLGKSDDSNVTKVQFFHKVKLGLRQDVSIIILYYNS